MKLHIWASNGTPAVWWNTACGRTFNRAKRTEVEVESATCISCLRKARSWSAFRAEFHATRARRVTQRLEQLRPRRRTRTAPRSTA